MPDASQTFSYPYSAILGPLHHGKLVEHGHANNSLVQSMRIALLNLCSPPHQGGCRTNSVYLSGISRGARGAASGQIPCEIDDLSSSAPAGTQLSARPPWRRFRSIRSFLAPVVFQSSAFIKVLPCPEDKANTHSCS